MLDDMGMEVVGYVVDGLVFGIDVGIVDVFEVFYYVV